MRLAKPLAAVLSIALLSFAGAAGAQERATPIEYHFNDDQMLGTTLSSNLAILRVRPHTLRVTLIRPRASFVAEMLTSVETM